MAQQKPEHTILWLAGIGVGVWYAYSQGWLANLLPQAASSTSGNTATSPVLPATPALAAGGTAPTPLDSQAVASGNANQPNLELYNSTNFGNYWTDITGSSTSVNGETIGSVRSNGGNFTLYAGPNYTGASVSTGGLDYQDATNLLSSLGGTIGSVKYTGPA